ncbi:MAG: hypothetical protein DWI25_07485 [Planctomycetota bacterium]|nr:MAG: hypothetical protein DWI25_07485 [Planctomycetota bacterium]
MCESIRSGDKHSEDKAFGHGARRFEKAISALERPVHQPKSHIFKVPMPSSRKLNAFCLFCLICKILQLSLSPKRLCLSEIGSGFCIARPQKMLWEFA